MYLPLSAVQHHHGVYRDAELAAWQTSSLGRKSSWKYDPIALVGLHIIAIVASVGLLVDVGGVDFKRCARVTGVFDGSCSYTYHEHVVGGVG